MNPQPNADGIFLLVILNVILSYGLGFFLDGGLNANQNIAEERVGCTCAAPLFFCLNMCGIGILIVFNWLGILGSVWSWGIGIALPYMLIALLMIQAERRTKVG